MFIYIFYIQTLMNFYNFPQFLQQWYREHEKKKLELKKKSEFHFR